MNENTAPAGELSDKQIEDVRHGDVVMPNPKWWVHTHDVNEITEACTYRLMPGDIKDGWVEHPLFTADQMTDAVQAALAAKDVLLDAKCAEIERRKIKIAALSAERDALRKDAEWQPLTPELLIEFESGGMGRYWLAHADAAVPLIGEYEWHQGWNPHGFNTDSDGRVSASAVTHVMPFVPPELPAMAKAVQPTNIT